MEDRIRKLIEDRLGKDGYTAAYWKEDARGTAELPGAWIAIEDLDRGMVSDGEEGTLSVTVVGSPEHGNERVQYGFTAEGSDVPANCTPGVDVEEL